MSKKANRKNCTETLSPLLTSAAALLIKAINPMLVIPTKKEMARTRLISLGLSRLMS